MTPEEFKAAGLDKLSAEELRALNAWLGRTLTTETATAAEPTRSRRPQTIENRGFVDSAGNEPIVAPHQRRLQRPARARHFTLDNGQVWQQIDDRRTRRRAA